MPMRLDNEITRHDITAHNPIADGFLQWNHSCDGLLRLVNSATYSKVFLDNRIVSIGKLERVMDSVCTKAPGTVTMIDENFWQVAVADGVVRISAFLDDMDLPITAQNLADRSHIIEGGKLPILTLEQSKWFAMAHALAMSSEPHCSQRLARFENPELSCVQNRTVQLPA